VSSVRLTVILESTAAASWKIYQICFYRSHTKTIHITFYNKCRNHCTI